MRLIKHDEGIWSAEGGPIPFRVPPFPGRVPYQLRMIVIRLPGGDLFIHSPIQPDEELIRETIGLGPIRHIVSPNKLHHLYLGQWAELFREARLYASPGLSGKRRDLRFHGMLSSTPEPAWRDVIDQRLVRGSFYMQEVVFFHRPSRTVILGDIIENHDQGLMSPWPRRWARLNCMLAPNGETPRNYRASFIRRNKTRIDLQAIMDWHPERVLLMHGPNVESGAAEFLQNGFRWASA